MRKFKEKTKNLIMKIWTGVANALKKISVFAKNLFIKWAQANGHIKHTEKWCKKITKYGDKYNIPIKEENFDSIKEEVRVKNFGVLSYSVSLFYQSIIKIFKVAWPILIAFILYWMGGEKGENAIYEGLVASLNNRNVDIARFLAETFVEMLFLVLVVATIMNLVNAFASVKTRKQKALDNLTYDFYKEIKKNEGKYPRKKNDA